MVFFLLDFSRHQQCEHRWHKGERENKGGDQCDDDGESHGREHFTFDAGKGQQGQIDHDDDALAEERGAHHFAAGRHDFIEPLLERQQALFMMLAQGETPQAILGDDDGTIDDEPEI